MEGAPAGLGGWDALWLALYFLALAAVVICSARSGREDSEQYFLGGRSAPWYAIGCSLFASNVGTDHLLGLAGSGAAGGLAVGAYELSACGALLLLGWLFVPHYLAHEVFTVPEFLERRFGPKMRAAFTLLTILSTILTKVSVTIFAGAVILESVLGWSFAGASAALLALTAAYTMAGGLAAVIYTEVLQSLLLLLGSAALLYFGLGEAGGVAGLRERLPPGHFRVLRPLGDRDFPWLGVLLGMPINSVWYWCTDQVMVQRVLASDRPETCQRGCLFAGYLKLLPMYLMVLPGLVAAALYPEEVERESNKAYVLLVTRLLPPGWVGVMVAVMLSSFMAALASCFNSCSTLFTMDVYTKLFPGASEQHLVVVGRGFTLLTAALSLLWLPVVGQTHDQLFLYIQSMQVVWAAPVTAVFLGALLLPGLGALAAWLALAAGMAAGLIFWLLQNAAPRGAAWAAPAREFCILHWSVASLLLSGGVLLAAHRLLEGGERGERLPLVAVEEEEKVRSRLERQQWAGPSERAAALALLLAVALLTVFPLAGF